MFIRGLYDEIMFFFLCLSLEGTAKYKFDWKDRQNRQN